MCRRARTIAAMTSSKYGNTIIKSITTSNEMGLRQVPEKSLVTFITISTLRRATPSDQTLALHFTLKQHNCVLTPCSCVCLLCEYEDAKKKVGVRNGSPDSYGHCCWYVSGSSADFLVWQKLAIAALVQRASIGQELGSVLGPCGRRPTLLIQRTLTCDVCS